MKLYTVFTPKGSQRLTPLGMPVLCTTIASVRNYAHVGDTVQAWGSHGQNAGTWDVIGHGSKLILSKQKGR